MAIASCSGRRRASPPRIFPHRLQPRPRLCWIVSYLGWTMSPQEVQRHRHGALEPGYCCKGSSPGGAHHCGSLFWIDTATSLGNRLTHARATSLTPQTRDHRTVGQRVPPRVAVSILPALPAPWSIHVGDLSVRESGDILCGDPGPGNKRL
jgi:hypothetical protein